MTAVRVLFVSPHAKAGGAERYLESLIDELGDPWIGGIVVLEGGPLVDRLRRRGHEVRVIDTGAGAADMAKATVALRQEVRRVRPAAIHANGVKAAIVAVAAGAGLRRPVVWLKHDHSFDRTLSIVAALGSRRVVGVSRSVVAPLPAVVRRKVRVVPNGIRRPAVDLDSGRAALRELMRVPLDTPVVGLVGRLHPLKGHDDLIRGIPEVLAAVPEARFAFLGGPVEPFTGHPSELVRLAEEEGVADRVSWLGHHEPPFHLMTGFDVAVMPSKAFRGRTPEGFPLSAVELMSVGVPVVGYSHAGIAEALGGCGLLVPPDDRTMLARAVVRVLSETGVRRQMRECGFRRARELDLASVADRMRSLYREVAA